MILHHYIWGDIDIDIVEEVAPHFLIAKHYGNLALFCRLTKHQNHYFRNSDKSFYAAGFDDEGKSMNPSDEYIPFVPDILYDDDGIGYLRSSLPYCAAKRKSAAGFLRLETGNADIFTKPYFSLVNSLHFDVSRP